jgi:methylase of polypeptide subunit release factors
MPEPTGISWSPDAARDLITRCSQLRDAGKAEAVLIAEFQSRLRTVFPDPADETWVNHYSEGTETHAHVGTVNGKTASRFIDELIHSTVIEYEPDLRVKSRRDGGYEQVRDYVSSQIRAGVPISQIRGVLSDTVEWYVFEVELPDKINPSSCTKNDISLREIDRFVPSGSPDDADRFASFLRKHLAREQSRALTSENISLDLGLESVAFGRHVKTLVDLVDTARKSDPSVDLATGLWSQFVDSLEPRDDGFRTAMYVDELYVALLARLLAANVLNQHAILSDDEELRQILTGEYFANNFRLKNMVEEDYFGWVLREAYVKAILKVAHEVQRDLYAYNFGVVGEQDLFGRLMAQLARRSQRKLLGQEWTPSWLGKVLAVRCLDGLKAGVQPRFVDMCCGSGSIVAEVINETKRRQIATSLEELALTATGFDIDPLAVTLSKTTWVITLADELRDASTDIVIPIYHADSLFVTTPVAAKIPEPGAPTDFVVKLDGKAIDIPQELIGPQLSGLFDDIVDWSYDEARAALGGGTDPNEERASTFVDNLVKRHRVTLDESVRRRIQRTAFALSKRITELAKANRNGIWAFILRNAYRPGLLAGQFNGLVSNPPWLAMSQLADNPYKKQLAARAKLYGINPGGAAHLHLDLATTYLIHAVDRYLGPSAVVACLLPGTIFNGQQHQKFRDAQYLASDRPVPFELREVWEIAAKTFKVRAAAVVGRKRASTNAVSKSSPAGYLVSEDETEKVKFSVQTLGTRTAWVLGEGTSSASSESDDVPRQGADLMPRTAVCVEITSKTGPEWRVKTPTAGSPTYFAVKDAKALKGKSFPGLVAPRFIYRMLQSNNLEPFTLIEPFAPIAIPAIKQPSGRWQILDSASIRSSGFVHTARRFERIDQTLLAEGVVKRLAGKIDELKKLSAQVFSKDAYVVVNGAGGGISCAAMFAVRDFPDLIIDQTLYWKAVTTEPEAWYRVALLNSAAISQAVKAFNPKGEFGARHLHTLPNRVIPAFNSKDPRHQQLAALAKRLHADANAVIQNTPPLRDLSKPVAGRRSRLRKILDEGALVKKLEALAAEVLLKA